MSGIDYKIRLGDARQAHREHQAGWSLRAIAERNSQRWGYASPKSALEGLRGVLRELELPVRDRIDATVRASTVHGNASRASREPGHPEHAAFLAHRRRLRTRERST